NVLINSHTHLSNGTQTIFVVTSSNNGSLFFHRLHAIDLSTGQDRLAPTVIAGSVPGPGPAPTFIALHQRSRAALLLLNGVVYTCWSSYCDDGLYAGWIISYDEKTLARVAVVNLDPSGDSSGNTIWQAGNGPAVDASGYFYVATGNGPFDTPLNGTG